MKRSRSIVGIAVGVSILVLTIAGVLSYRAVQQLARTGEDVVRAKELELSMERLLSTIRDAETGQRGYVMSGDTSYLAPYDAALQELEGRLATVEARSDAVGLDPTTLAELRRVVGVKLAEMARTIDLLRSGERSQALAVVRTDEGKVAMDVIRDLVASLAQAQRTRVERLLAAERDALRSTITSSVAVTAVAGLLLLLLTYIVRRDTERVRLSEQRLATTLQSIGDAVIATDAEGRVSMMNPVAESLTGWRIESAATRPLDEVFRIVNENTRETVESPVTKVLREGGIVGLANHTVLIKPSGEETAIEDSGAPITDTTGNTTGVVLVFRDATKERAVQNALIEADRRKDEFLATLAHELRNPLAPIRQAVRVAAHPDATAEQIRWSHAVIARQASHMARLLDDLLDVSRITRGRLEVRKERVELRSIVDSAVETVQPTLEERKHELAVELPAEALMLEVDALRIAQVLGNLLTNAAKYTPEGGRIRLVADASDGRVQIRVIDNGIGLSATDLPQIFAMFAQVTPTMDRKEGGLGIGLALSKALIELHGGSLEARSAGQGQGSEFVVRLALAPADRDTASK